MGAGVSRASENRLFGKGLYGKPLFVGIPPPGKPPVCPGIPKKQNLYGNPLHFKRRGAIYTPDALSPTYHTPNSLRKHRRPGQCLGRFYRDDLPSTASLAHPAEASKRQASDWANPGMAFDIHRIDKIGDIGNMNKLVCQTNRFSDSQKIFSNLPSAPKVTTGFS